MDFLLSEVINLCFVAYCTYQTLFCAMSTWYFLLRLAVICWALTVDSTRRYSDKTLILRRRETYTTNKNLRETKWLPRLAGLAGCKTPRDVSRCVPCLWTPFQGLLLYLPLVCELMSALSRLPTDVSWIHKFSLSLGYLSVTICLCVWPAKLVKEMPTWSGMCYFHFAETALGRRLHIHSIFRRHCAGSSHLPV